MKPNEYVTELKKKNKSPVAIEGSFDMVGGMKSGGRISSLFGAVSSLLSYSRHSKY
jgi:hypothetical protein